MNMGYDYYGAPISIADRKSKWYGGVKVGNGGYSLRKLDTMISICSKYGETKAVEDVWFCITHGKEMKICPVEVAKKFSTIADYLRDVRYPWLFLSV